MHAIRALLFTPGWICGGGDACAKWFATVDRTGQRASWPFGRLRRCTLDVIIGRCLHYVLQTMIELLAHLSWLLPNVAVPILAPIALLPLLNFSLADREIAGDVLKMALRHGQLFWTVIAMSASASYELGCALDQPMSASGHSWVWVGLVWHVAFIVGSSVVVVFGAADARKYFNGVDICCYDSNRRDDVRHISFFVSPNTHLNQVIIELT
jgi:hypothetical protein